MVIGPKNKRRTLNRDKVRLVDPESDWDTLRPRLTRTQRPPLHHIPVPPKEQPQQSPPIRHEYRTDRQLHSHKRRMLADDPAVVPAKCERILGPTLRAKRKPSPLEQAKAKRQCIPAVRLFCC